MFLCSGTSTDLLSMGVKKFVGGCGTAKPAKYDVGKTLWTFNTPGRG